MLIVSSVVGIVLKYFPRIRANLCSSVGDRSHVVFSSENRIFQTFLTKKLHFALFICQYGFFFVPLRAFYGVLYFAP